MIIILQKPTILCDNEKNFKSWSYFKNMLTNGISDISDVICLPTIFVFGSIISFILSKYILEINSS